MNADLLIARIARALADVKLEAVLIGNAAAALQGAPVTTVDFDFMYRPTAPNRAKLERLAAHLDARTTEPHYPASRLVRIVSEDGALQLDFMAEVHGVRSFAGLRRRATNTRFRGCALLVASLEDIIRSKEAADRPRDRADVPVLRATQREKETHPKRAAQGPEAGK
jgi:hypothetical protein